MKKCPRCGSNAERVSNTLICKCGWTYSKKEEASQALVIFSMVLVFSLTAGALFHFFQWGSYGLKIFFASLDEKVEICMDLKKYDCVEKNYLRLFQTTNDIQFLEELGELQFKREKFAEASETYGLYFSKKGQSYKAAYYYAHSLVKMGDLDLAIQYFDSIIRSRPHVLMLTVMESYLEILVAHKRIKKAREILSWVHQTNKGAVDTNHQIQAWRKKFKI